MYILLFLLWVALNGRLTAEIATMVGNFRFGYVLNRMQVGATSDTLGAALIIFVLIVASGINATTVKLVVMVAFLWFAKQVWNSSKSLKQYSL